MLIKNAFFLADEVSEQMLLRLELMSLQPQTIILLGSALSYSAELLKKRYPAAKIIMEEKVILSLPKNSVDLIFANLVLPWEEDLNPIFMHWRRLLRTEGLLLFSSFGPDTLVEGREQWADYQLIHLIDMHIIGDALIQARFSDPVLDVEHLTVTFKKLENLIADLQAGNLLTKELPAMTLGKVNDNYPLTFEIVYAHAWGPSMDVDHTANDEGIVKIPLAHIRKLI